MIVAAILLAGAGPVLAELQWRPADGERVLAAAGTRVTVSARRCAPDDRSDACYFGHGIFNAAQLAIREHGRPAMRVEVNESGADYRIALVRLRSGDRRPGLVVESDPGGSGGGNVVTVFMPSATGMRRTALGVPTVSGHTTVFPRPLVWPPRDINRDGRVDFVVGDPLFGGSPWGCHACEVLPPRVLTLADDGTTRDLSATPAARRLFARQLATTRAACLSRDADTNTDYRHPACAAYLADAARLGGFAAAWRRVAALPQSRVRDQGGSNFLASVRETLRAGGYLP